MRNHAEEIQNLKGKLFFYSKAVQENALLVSQATNQIEVIGELLQRGLNWKRLFDRVKWANRS